MIGMYVQQYGPLVFIAVVAIGLIWAVVTNFGNKGKGDNNGNNNNRGGNQTPPPAPPEG